MPSKDTISRPSQRGCLTSLREFLIFGGIFLFTLAICVWATVTFRKRHIENDLHFAALTALSNEGLEGKVTVTFEYFDASLYGEVRSSGASTRAKTVVSEITGIRKVHNFIIDLSSPLKRKSSDASSSQTKNAQASTPPAPEKAANPSPEPAKASTPSTVAAPKVTEGSQSKENAASPLYGREEAVLSLGSGQPGTMFSQSPISLDRFESSASSRISLEDDEKADSDEKLPVPPRPKKTSAKEDQGHLAAKSVDAQLKLYPVFFLSGSTLIPPRESAKILKTANLLKASHEDVHFTVVGVSDNHGNSQNNKNLALKRAAAVRDALVSQGIAAHRLKLRSSVATNTSIRDAWKHRKVELNVVRP